MVSLHDAGHSSSRSTRTMPTPFWRWDCFCVRAGVLLVKMAGSRLQLFRAHIRPGCADPQDPERFARVVVAPQIVDWILRVGWAYYMLAAFGITAALRYALLVVVIDSVSTALPFTPGGVGAQQGLLVFAIGGAATSARIPAFSLGAQAVIVAIQRGAGLFAAAALFGHIRMGVIRREAYAWRDLHRRDSP